MEAGSVLAMRHSEQQTIEMCIEGTPGENALTKNGSWSIITSKAGLAHARPRPRSAKWNEG